MVAEGGILILTLLCLAVQCYYWIVYFFKVGASSFEPSSVTNDPVSVIICARDEVENLQKLLPLILQQHYASFEVILVDHASQDHTESALKVFESYPNFRYVRCSDPVSSKKPALQLGLQLSRYDHVLVTDADCLPSSPYWIRTMMAPFSAGYKIILGAAPLSGGNGLLGCFCKLDSAMIFLQYSSATRRGQSYMGVGRNMAYQKSLYLHPDHNKYPHYLGGDDDLFVSQFVSSKIALVYDPLALMSSPSSDSWFDFYRGKRRHVSVSWEYAWPQKLHLMVFAGSHWGLLVGLLIMVSLKIYILPLGLLLAKQLLTYLVIKTQAKSFVKETSWFCLLFTEIFYLFHYPLLAIFLMVKPPEKW